MSVKTRKQSAKETEREILNYLKTKKVPITFYKLYTDLKYTSGKAQSAVRRLQKKGEIITKRAIMKFQTFILDKDFDLEPKIIKNLDEELMIFPFTIPYTVGAILKQIPKVSDDYSNFIDLVTQAVIEFFQEKLPYELKRKAILLAIKKGKISEGTGKFILGE